MKNAAIILSALCLIVGVALSSFADSNRQIKKRPLHDSKNQIKKTDLTQKVPKLPPDLIISIDASDKAKAGEKIPHCKVVVTNVGKSTARGTSSNGSNGYMVDLVLSSNNHIPVGFAGYSPNFSDDVLLKGGRISNTPDLAPNQSKTFSLNNVLTIPNDTKSGGYCLGGIADSGKKITERNENNNTTCRKLRVKGKGAPDLVVSNIKTVKDCKIKVTIRNIGSAGVPDSGYDMQNGAAVQMYNGSQPWGGIRLGAIDPARKLKVPGGTVSHIWFPGAANLDLGPGIHSLKLVVDNNNAVTESNENNNRLTKRLECEKGKPDLIVSELRFTGNCIIGYTIKNTGAVGVPASAYTNTSKDFLRFYDGNKSMGGVSLKDADPYNHLQTPGGSASGTSYPGNYTPQGAHRIEIIVDAADIVDEYNENNNSRQLNSSCSP